MGAILRYLLAQRITAEHRASKEKSLPSIGQTPGSAASWGIQPFTSTGKKSGFCVDMLQVSSLKILNAKIWQISAHIF